MIINAVYCVLLCFWCCENVVDSTDWVDDLTDSVVKDSELNQVKIMTRLSDGEFLENLLIDELLMKLMQNVHTTMINFREDFQLPANSVPDEISEDENFDGTKSLAGSLTPRIDTSATLFLLVVESRDSLPIPMTKNFIDVVAKMSAYHYTAKYLLVSFVREPTKDVKKLLKYAWTKKILDFTIVEFPEPRVPRNSILIHRPLVRPVIHRLNPFKKEYTTENSSALRNDLFPPKDTNFWRYRLRVREAYFGVPMINEETPEERVSKIFRQKYNVSVIYCRNDEDKNSLENGRQVYTDVADLRADLTESAVPFFFVGWNDTQRTSTIAFDQFCVAVPILQSTKSSISVNFFMVFLVAFSIILIFWLFVLMLGLKSYPWRMFNIGLVLFGISVSQQPRDKISRILFTSLLLIFAINSSTIYGMITEITIENDSEMQFQSFDDLDKSGLPIVMTEESYHKVKSLYDSGPLTKFANKTVITKAIGYGCVADLYNYKNVTCLLSSKRVKTLIGGKRSFKLANPCLWNDPLNFVVSKRSPYRSRLDKLIMRLHDVGILSKKSQLDLFLQLKARFYSQSMKPKETPLYRQLIFVSIVGYSLSIVAFISEIIFHRVSMFRQRKVRSLRQFPGKPNKIHSRSRKNVVPKKSIEITEL